MLLRVAALAAYHLLLMHWLLVTPSFCPQSGLAIQSESFVWFLPQLKICPVPIVAHEIEPSIRCFAWKLPTIDFLAQLLFGWLNRKSQLINILNK